MTSRTVIRGAVPAGSTRRLRAAIRDERGALLPVSDLAALTVTITDEVTGAVVNGRNGQDILGLNGGTVSAAGQLVLWLGPADNGIQVAGKTREVRCVLIEWEYGGGKRGKHEVVFAVVR